MCTVSFTKDTLNINIHNLYPDVELISPVYCGNGVTCHTPSSRQTDTGTIVEASFGIDFRQKDIKAALLYKLQRKHTAKTGNHSNSSIASIEDTATSIYLLVVWNVTNERIDFPVCLLECTDDFTWDEDKLWALCHQYNVHLYENYDYRVIMWLMHGDTVMKIRRDVIYGSNCKLDIVISEGTGKYSMERPMKIDPKRLVLPLSILIVLIYALSLPIRPSFELSVHNRCLNIDLVSPTYIIGYGLELHRAPDYKVCIGDIMRTGFIIESDKMSYGALIYIIQKEQSHEYADIGKDASSAAQLLVVWRISELKELYADVLLVEYNKTLDKDDLEKLYRESFDKFRWFRSSATNTWSLDDDTALMTTFEVMNEDHILNITIDEVERDSSTRILAHINPER
jgi:hypothetical protein